MTRHTCQLNEDNGFICDVCDRKRERAVTDFDRWFRHDLSDTFRDMRLPEATRDCFLDELLDAYVDARMEDGDEE